MNPFVISLMFSAGATTWIYTKFQRTSGNNTRQSVYAAGAAGLVIFIIFFYITNSLLK